MYWRPFVAAGCVLATLSACTGEVRADSPPGQTTTQPPTAATTAPAGVPPAGAREIARLVITETSVQSRPGTPAPNTAYVATGGCLTTTGKGRLSYVITAATDPDAVLGRGKIDCEPSGSTGTPDAAAATPVLAATSIPGRVQVAPAGLPDGLITGYVLVVPQE